LEFNLFTELMKFSSTTKSVTNSTLFKTSRKHRYLLFSRSLHNFHKRESSWIIFFLSNALYFCASPGFSYLVSFITEHCCLNKHLHRMGLTTSPVCASCQLKEETALYFVFVCSTLAALKTCIFCKSIMNASEFAGLSASTILRFAFQSGVLKTSHWHIYLFNMYVVFLFLF
jgi:hypothetical protein